MGLIKKISEARDQELLLESQERLTEERTSQERGLQRLVIVTSALEAVALRLEEPLRQVDEEAIGLPKYFVLGDLVVSVQLFAAVNPQELSDPSVPHLVLAEYYAALVGVDKRSGSLEHCRVGMLKWLSYDGIYRTFTVAPSYLNFETETVLEKLGL